MQENQDQTTRLKGFTEQRDLLVSELAFLTADKDQLEKTNKWLTIANAGIVVDVQYNNNKLTEAEDEYREQVIALKTDLANTKSDLEGVVSRREMALKELESITEQMVTMRQNLLGVSNAAEELSKWFKDIKIQVSDSSLAFIKSAKDMATSVTGVQTLVYSFKAKLVDQEVENFKTKAALDIRSEKLDQRDQAINETYRDVVADMKTRGIKLEDLN